MSHNLATPRSARRRRAWHVLGRLPGDSRPVLVAYVRADGKTVGVVTDLAPAAQVDLLRGLAGAAEARLPARAGTVEEASR
jgi:hypothetical protein